DLERLGQQMDAVDGGEAEAGDVIALQEIQDLDQVDPATRRRRAAGDLEAAVAPADGGALDGAIAAQVVEGDEAARAPHVLDDAPAERTAVEGPRPLGRDRPQRPRVLGLHEPIA